MLGVMSYISTLLGALVLVLAFQESQSEQPYSWAPHVCSTSTYRTSYYQSLTSRVYYRSWYSKCGLWGWGRCKRTQGYRTYYYVTRSTSSLHYRYYCCSGWRRSGRYCSKPICFGYAGCRNGGTCVSPNNCRCKSGFYGSRCQYDRNECSSSNGGCQQVCTNYHGSYTCSCYRGYRKSSTRCKDINECVQSDRCRCGPNIDNCGANCTNTPGSYRCLCGTGYRLLRKGNCVDDDECTTGSHSCAQTCVNTVGSYKSLCRPGFLTKQDGRVCEDINECQTNNGGCQHTCQNTQGFKQCLCRDGFSLNNDNKTCSDIDECTQDSPCEFNCTNTVGSFRCSCQPGFKLTSNGRTCTDIDECSESFSSVGKSSSKIGPIANCQQKCVNTQGSFKCACRSGFELREDGILCRDIDECTLGTHKCSHICKNTYGSYQCSCVTGYGLKADGKVCQVLPCRTLVQQPHGTMNCTGMAKNDNCSFTCNHGYYLKGPSTITCTSSSRWSENQAVCKAKSCGRIDPPTGGTLTLPCYNTYGSSCQMRCSVGYYPTGNSTVMCDLTKERNKVAWKNNFRCHRSVACQPNPCRHGGKCVITTTQDFKCDCSNTGYEGSICDQGVIDIPLFPKLKAHLKSPPLSLRAKPAMEIQVLIGSDDDVVVEPKKLKLSQSSTKADFTITSKKSGFKVISFSVLGENAKDFKNPAKRVIFVGPEKSYRKTIFAKIPILPGELPSGCDVKQINLTKCSVKSISSQPWREQLSKEDLSSSLGIIHLVTTRGLPVPLSLFGSNFPYSSESLVQNAILINQTPQRRHDFTGHRNKCFNATIDVLQFLQLIEQDVFASSFFDAFSRNGPGWLKFEAKEMSKSFDLKNIHAVAAGSELKGCPSVLKSPSVVYFSPNIGSKVIIDNEDLLLPDEQGSCYAIDVCTSAMSWVLSKGSASLVKEWSVLKKLRQAGWDIELKQVMLSGDERLTTEFSIWDEEKDGKKMKHDVLLRGKIMTKLNNSENGVNLSLNYDGDIYMNTDNINDAMQFGFDARLTSIFKGRAALKINAVGNIPINMQLPLGDVVGKAIIGGGAGNQFMSFRWKTSGNAFQGTPLVSLIQKYEGRPVDVIIDVEAQGGREEERTNITEIRRSISLISSILPQVKSIINNIEIKHRVSNEVTKRHKTVVSEVESLVNNIQDIVKKHPHLAVNNERKKKELTHSISDLHVKVENVRYLCKVLISALDDGVSKLNTAPVIAQLRSKIAILPRVMSVRTKRFPVSQTFRGFELKVEGKMCAGKLCFENMIISVKKNQDSLMIRGLATRNLKLSRVLSLSKGEEVIMKIHGKGNRGNRVLFRPTADILGIKQVVLAEIMENTMKFNASGLLLGQHEAMIDVEANTNVAEWKSLKFKVNGILNQNTSLIKDLQTKINYRILQLAKKAKQRIKNAKNDAVKARQRVNVLKKLVKEKREALNKLEKQKQRCFIAWRLAESKYRNFTSLDGKSKNGNISKEPPKSSGISRRSVHENYPCQIREKCPKQKIASRSCVTRQEEVKIKIPVEICDGNKKITIMEEKVVSKVKQSYYTIPTYKNVLVSSCGTYKFSKTGVLIGAIVGGVLTLLNPVGIVAGAFIGGLIGGFIELFTGCTMKSVRVKGPDEKVWFYMIYYERKSFPKHEDIPNCYEETKVVPGGLGPPHPVCSKTFTDVPDVSCLSSNQRCFEQLSSLPAINLAESKKLFERHRLANQEEGARMKLDQAIWERNKLNSELETATSQLINERKARDKSSSAISELMKLKNIKTGLRLSENLGKWKPSEMASVSEIRIDSVYTGNFIGDSSASFHLPTVLTMNSAMANFWDSFTFAPDFLNILSFVGNVFAGIIDTFLDHIGSRARRIGRSLELQPMIPPIDTNPSVPQKFKAERELLSLKVINTSTLQLAANEDECLIAKHGNQFFKDIVMHLQRQILDQEMISNSSGVSQENHPVYHAIRNLKETPKNKNMTGVNETDVMLDAYLDLMDSVTKQRASILSWDDILNDWKSFLEELAKGNSFSYCAGAKDCVEETGGKLHELYYYREDLPRATEIKSLLPNITGEIMYLMTQNITMKEAKEKTSTILHLLNRTVDETVLCGKKPDFNFTWDQDQAVVEGQSFALDCNASSDTPMLYTWIHNGETLFESVADSVLKIENATVNDQGAYKCKAANHKGYVISNVTLVEINSKPKITGHPNDTQVYTKDPTGTFLLNCNATGNPEPDIEWFFISQYPNSSEVKIYNDNGTFLFYEQLTTNFSGYYYCVARNIHGRAESKRARVWVLDMSPGEPLLAASINVTKACKTNKRSRNCGTFVQSQSKDENDNDLRIIKDGLGQSLNTSQLQISKVMYNRNTKQSATVVFLYKSDKLEEAEKSNDTDIDPVAQEYARKRKQLLMGLRKLYQDAEQRLLNASSENEVIDADPNSLSILDVDIGCPTGQTPHANGYMCENCPPETHGTEDGQCIPCPLGTYQYEQGQVECIPCDNGFITEKEGALSSDECIDMRPSPPRNLKAAAISSTILKVRWLAPARNRTSMWYYFIKHGEVGKQTRTERVPKTVTSWTLTRLKKFTDYHIIVYAANYYGMTMSEIIAKTGEHVPDAAPRIVHNIQISNSTMNISWLRVPVHQRNGIIQGYHIYFREVSERKWQVYTTPTGNVTHAVVPGLKSYTEYCVKISPFTSKGEYPDWKRESCKKVKNLFIRPLNNLKWNTAFLEAFSLVCKGSERSIWNIQSAHENDRHDRVWSYQCRNNSYITTTCAWTLPNDQYLNDYNGTVNFKCPRNGYIVGMHANTFNDVYKDRRFNFKCCDGTRLRRNCTWTSYVNYWNGDMDYEVSSGYYLAGASSYHLDQYQDRRWKFFICQSNLDWDTKFFESFSMNCKGPNESIWNIESTHDNNHADRVWGYYCRHNPYITTTCAWSLLNNEYLNDYHGNVDFICPRNGYIDAMYARKFDNVYKDRRFDFRCCDGTRPWRNCTWTPYVNEWDDYMNYKVPSGYYLAGAYSYHLNSYQDRRWKFYICQ